MEAKPREKRDWRLAEVDSSPRLERTRTARSSVRIRRVPEHSPRLGEDDIATGVARGPGRHVSDVRVAVDDEAFDLSFDDEPPRLSSQSSDDTSTSDDERMRPRGSGKGRAGAVA